MTRHAAEIDRQIRSELRAATKGWHPDADTARAELGRRIARSDQRRRRWWQRPEGASLGLTLTAAVGVATMSIGLAVVPQVLPDTQASFDIRQEAARREHSQPGTGSWCCGGDPPPLRDRAPTCGWIRDGEVNPGASNRAHGAKRRTQIAPVLDKAWDASARRECITRVG